MDRIGTAVEFFKQQLRRRGAEGESGAPPVTPAPSPASHHTVEAKPTVLHDSPRTAGVAGTAEPPAYVETAQNRVTGLHRDAAGPIIYTRTRSVEVPLVELKERRVLTVLDDGSMAAAYRTLSAHVLRQMSEKQWNVLGVTSPGRGEGKTLTAVNLAISLAMESQFTVLLIDGDLAHPGVQDLLGLGTGGGLSDYLLRDASIEDLLVYPGIRRLTVLPAGQRLINPAELLGSEKMRLLAADLKQRYPSRMIIYDLACLHHAADVLSMSSCLDALLMVVEAGRTKVDEVENAARLLQGVPLIGTLLNKG